MPRCRFWASRLDPVASCGYGGLSLAGVTGGTGSGAQHGGASVALRNDALTRANPYANHLRYAMDSFEVKSLW